MGAEQFPVTVVMLETSGILMYSSIDFCVYKLQSKQIIPLITILLENYS